MDDNNRALKYYKSNKLRNDIGSNMESLIEHAFLDPKFENNYS